MKLKSKDDNIYFRIKKNVNYKIIGKSQERYLIQRKNNKIKYVPKSFFYEEKETHDKDFNKHLDKELD